MILGLRPRSISAGDVYFRGRAVEIVRLVYELNHWWKGMFIDLRKK